MLDIGGVKWITLLKSLLDPRTQRVKAAYVRRRRNPDGRIW